MSRCSDVGSEAPVRSGSQQAGREVGVFRLKKLHPDW